MNNGLVNVIALLTLTVVQGCTQTRGSSAALASYRGNGYTVWFPQDWKVTTNGSVAILDPPRFPAQFKIFSSPETSKEAFFQKYREIVSASAGFPVALGSSTEPMVYGSWFGTHITGQGSAEGLPLHLSATAIEANGYVYLLQMVTAQSQSFKGYELLAALGRSLVFDRPTTPAERQAVNSGGGCATPAQCIEIWRSGMSMMDSMNAQTLRGLR